MAVLALTLAGQAAGAAIGGSILGISAATIGGTVGMAVGQYFFGPKPQDQFGPRVRNLDSTTASEGEPIPIMWGSMRLPGTIIWAPKKEEVTRTQEVGGKGGQSATSTTYYAKASWCVSFGYNREGVARSVRRIWANKELIYDATGEGEVTKEGVAFTFYDGTQTEPDPVMEATAGIGNVPAYTGQALLVFEDQSLEMWGNNHPSIEAELVDDADVTDTLQTLFPTSIHGYEDGAPSANGHVWYDPYRELVWISFVGGNFGATHGAMFVINPYTGNLVFKYINSGTDGSGYMVLCDYEKRYDRIIFRDSDSTVALFDTANFQLLGNINTGSPAGITSNIAALFHGFIYTLSGGAFRWVEAVPGASYEGLTVPTGYSVLTGSWCVGRKTPSTNLLLERTPTDDEAHIFFRNAADTAYGYFRVTLPVGGAPVFTAVVSAYASAPLSEDITGFNLPDCGFWNSSGIYIEPTASYWFPISTSGGVSQAHLLEVEPSTGEVLSLYSLVGRVEGASLANWSVGNGHPHISYDPVGRRIWCALTQGSAWFSIDSLSGKLISEGQGGSVFHFHRSNGIAYGPSYDGVASSVTEIWKLNIGNVGQGRVAVASVVRDVISRVASTAAASAVFDNVTASCVGAVADSQMPARNMINPLLQYAYADGFESEYVFKFVRRGGAVATALSSTYLGATTGDPAPTKTTLPHEIELPRAVDVTFYNSENNFQRGDVNYTWWSGRSDRKTNVQLPLAVQPQEALEHCTRLLHAAYNKVPYEVTAGPRYGQLEPTDLVSLPLNGRAERVRLEQIRRGKNGLRNMLFMQDSEKDLEVYASAGGHTSREDAIANNGSVNLFWLNLPLLRDTDDEHPGPYVAQYNYASGFNGGTLNTSTDNNTYTTVFSFDAEPAWGIVNNTPIAVGSIGAWDLDNTLSVNMVDGGGTLETTTSAAVFTNQANAVAYGRPGRWEILQYLSAAVASSGAYELSTLLRGRRGTDAHIDSHTAGDFLVVLDENALRRLQYTVADIGTPIYTRSTRPGQSYADVVPAIFSVTNHALKPYSPISVAVASAADGIQLSWTPRTRANGSYVGLYDGVGPHGEATDDWHVDVINAASGSVVVSAIVTTSAQYFYASASQVADGTNQQGTISFNIFKISDSVGRGTPASVSYERPWPVGLKYALDLGADYVIPLNDAGTGTMKDWYGSAVGVWGGSTGVASTLSMGGTRYAAASVAADSSTSIGTLGNTLQSWANGRTTATFAVWMKPDDWSITSQYPLSTPGNNNTLGQYIRAGSFTVWSYITPNGTGSPISCSDSVAIPDRSKRMLVVQTVDTTTLTTRMFINGKHADSSTWGTGHSGHAGSLAWSAYTSASPGRVGAALNGTTAPFNGLIGDVMVFPTALSSAQVSTLYEKQQGHIDRVTTLGGTHLWTLDQSTTMLDGATELDRIGGSNLSTDYSNNASAVTETARRSGDFGTTNYCRTALPANMKTQVFTFEGWFKLDTLQASAPVFAAFPVGAYASARGLYVEQDSTSLNVHYGPGDGTFRTITATVAAASTYHWAVVKASAAAPVLFVNGSAKAAGVSAFDIEWEDGSGAPPTATVYLSRANFNRTADVSADVAGIDGKMGMIATYATALSSATIMESYLFGLKQL